MNSWEIFPKGYNQSFMSRGLAILGGIWDKMEKKIAGRLGFCLAKASVNP